MRRWEMLAQEANEKEKEARNLRIASEDSRCTAEEGGGWRCVEDKGHEAEGIHHRAELEW